MECPKCGTANADDAVSCGKCRTELSDFELTAARQSPIGQSRPGPGSSTDVGGGSFPEAPVVRRSQSRTLDVGFKLGERYQIVRQLGEGGMGEVFLARDRELDRDVALKIIRSELAANPAILERFKREIQLSTNVTHKNILRVYDLGEADGVKFLTMQFVPGQDLAALMRREAPLPVPRIVEIFRQICEGLQAAHEQGVIHRDLKPQNILLDERGRVAIGDFGLAKSLDYGTLTEAGKVIGTPHYMSPEQVKGIELDQRSDIYSLGIILYEMLTGTLPFTGSSAWEIMMQRTQRTPRPASDHNPKIPRYLVKVLDRCLQIDPNLRYASTAEILRDLETKTFHSTLNYQVRRSGRTAKFIGIVALIAFVAAGVATWRHFAVAKQQATEAAHAPVSVLVADIDNKTGDGVFDGTLEPIVTLAMEGASFVTSYSRGQARKVAAQIQPQATSLGEGLARLIAVREGLGVVITGSIAKGNSYDLTLRALDGATGKPIGESQVKAETKEQVLAAVGRAAADLRQALGDTTPVSTQIAAAETFTAGSLEAAHEYAIGQDLFLSGKFEEAANHWQQAVKLDPSFGRAYAGLGAAYNNLGRQNDAEAQYKLAMSHIDRMTERERFRTRATYYLVTHNNGRAIDELTQLVKQYPSDVSGLNNLALAYFYQRDMARAVEASQHPIALYPKNVVARNNAALYAMYAGNFDQAKQQAQAALQINPKFELAYLAIGLSEFGAGNIENASAAYKKLETMSGRGQSMASMSLADIALYQGRTKDAIAILTPAVERDRAETRTDAGNAKLATLAIAANSAGKASDVAKAASPHDPHSLFMAARALMAAGRDSDALRIASQFEAEIESELQSYGKLIEGEVLLKNGKAREALTQFEAAKKSSDSWLATFDRGRAYLELSAFTEADADFETCVRRRGEATAVFLDDIPTFHQFAPVYYYLGRAREGLGSASANDAYKQFVAIKQNGDGDPLVADARRRIK
jgi:tetratricopeptide (TPR) repeat protein